MCMMSRRLTTPPDLRDAYHDVVGIEDDGSVAADRAPQTDAGSRLARIERIRTIGDEPISYEQTYINQRDYPSFLELDSTGFIYQLLRTACSADIHTVEETIEVVPGHGPLHPSSKTADRSAAATRVLPSARLGRSLSGAVAEYLSGQQGASHNIKDDLRNNLIQRSRSAPPAASPAMNSHFPRRNASSGMNPARKRKRQTDVGGRPIKAGSSANVIQEGRSGLIHEKSALRRLTSSLPGHTRFLAGRNALNRARHPTPHGEEGKHRQNHATYRVEHNLYGLHSIAELEASTRRRSCSSYSRPCTASGAWPDVRSGRSPHH